MSKYPIEQVVPHAHPMILVDSLLNHSESTGSCSITINPQSIFYDPNHAAVPAWIGIEYLAQTIAAHASAVKLDEGNKVKIGFLVSTKNFKAVVSHFDNGDRLETFVSRVFKEPNGLGVFDCLIKRGEEILVEARINVFEPEDPSLYAME